MKTGITTTILTFLVAVAAAAGESAYPVDWTAQIGTTEREDSRSVAVDASGNVYISGYTTGDLGGPNAGGTDAFLSKFDASGNQIWTKLIGTSNNDLSNSVAVDASGDIYISGYTNGDLGGTSAGGKDAFLSKIDADGNALWTIQIGTSADDVSTSVAVAGSGDIYIGGTTSGDLDGTNAGGKDAFLSKFDTGGNALWTRQIGTSNTDCGLAVAVAVSGNVYITGRTYGDLGGPNAGGYDAFLGKFDADGNVLWTKQIGTSSPDESNAVAVDADGNVYISGRTFGWLDRSSRDFGHAFLIKLDADGNEAWRKQLGEQFGEGSRSIAVSASGNSYVSGHTDGDLGGRGEGGMDGFLSKVDADGNEVWSTQMGTSEWDESFAVALDASDNVYITGTTRGDLGGHIAGSYDAFLVKYQVGQPGQEKQPFTPGGFTAIAASAHHSFALTADGHIVSWGAPNSPLVNNTPIIGGITTIAGGYKHCLALAADGRIVSWGADPSQARDMPKARGFTAVAAGQSHSLALTADGHIVSWGSGRQGVVSDTPADGGFTAIAAGYDYSVAIAADGTVVGWGQDESGQVSDIHADRRFTAIAAGRRHVLALTPKGHIASWGNDEFGQVSDAPTDGGFIAIVAGDDNCLALTADGTVVFWGKDDHRELKRGPTASGFVAIAIGRRHAFALTAEGHIVSWGKWRDANVTATPRTSKFVAIAAGYVQSLALTADGFIVAWGLGSEATPTTSGFTAIAAGRRHALALTADGRIVSWGDDEFGQVSDTPTDAGFAAIAAGQDHSVALTADGRIVSWGDDESGQVSDTPLAAGFTAIAPGHEHSLALTADGHIVSWGRDDAKQVSNTPTGGGFAAIAAGYAHGLALTADGDLVSWGAEDPKILTRTSITYTPAGSDFTAIVAGGHQNLVLTHNGRVKQWGGAWSGTYSPSERGFVAIAIGSRHSLALRADGTIYSWGDCDYGEIRETPTANAFVPGSISGRVFVDRNANGQRDAGELGLNGWTVELMDAASQTVVATRTTASIDLDSDGWIDPDSETGVYEFRDLAPDDYEVSAPQQDGWARTLPRRPWWYDAPLSLGRKDAASLDFGNVAYGAVEGLVWADVDSDNVHDVDEPGLAGWTVKLVDAASGAVVDTQVTAGDASGADDTAGPQAQAGRYSFKKVPIGSYEVRPTLQTGWSSTAPIVATGELAQTQLIEHDLSPHYRRRLNSMAISSDGRHVYTAGYMGSMDNRNNNGMVGVFARDLLTGELSFINAFRPISTVLVRDISSVAVSGDGAHVYAAGYCSGPVAVLARDLATGRLDFVQTITPDDADVTAGLKGDWSLAMSDDGSHVYAVAGLDDEGVLVVFARDAATGKLTFVQSLRDGVDGVDGLADPRAVAVSPDGANVYVTGRTDDSVAVFARDAATGKLDVLQVLRSGVDGVDGLDGPLSVTVSRDSAHVYVASMFDSALTVFTRDAATGKLSLLQIVQDGVGGVDGLGWVVAVAVTDDGAHVYAIGYNDGALTVFTRDAATGELSLLRVLRDGVNGVDGLVGASLLTVSNDGRHVYAADDLSTMAIFKQLHGPPTIVDVPPNGRVTAVAFGVAETVDVGGRVFWDSDGDSPDGSGRRGLDGWRVQLLDAATGENVMTTVTASVDLDRDGAIDMATETGQYSFTDLPPGDYEVRLVLQPHWTRTSQSDNLSLTLVSGDPDVAGQDFGVAFANPAEIRGQVWEDLDGDGVRDAGEPGLDGWTVELVDQTARAVVGRAATASRDVNGDGAIDPETEAGLYSLQAVAPRVYEIRQVPPANWRQTAGPEISLPGIKFHIVYGDNDWHVDPFGMAPVWDRSDWLDIDPPRPAVWKMSDDHYTNVWRPSRPKDPKTFVAYTPGKDEKVYWFIIEDAQPDEALAKDTFCDLWVQITERHRPGKLLLTARHLSGAAAYQAIVGPDGTETEIPRGASVSILLDMLGFIEPAPGEIVEGLDFGNFHQGSD